MGFTIWEDVLFWRTVENTIVDLQTIALAITVKGLEIFKITG